MVLNYHNKRKLISYKKRVVTFKKKAQEAENYIASLIRNNPIRKATYASIIVCIFLGILSFNQDNPDEFFRNMMLGIAAFAAFPLLVWRSINVDEATKAANKSALVANQVHQQEIYAKAVEYLASEHESIRLGAVMSFKQIILESEDTELIQKTCDMLYCFMEEHSRDALAKYTKKEKELDTLEQDEYLATLDIIVKDTKQYYSQFYEIITLFTKVRKQNPSVKLRDNLSKICLICAEFFHYDFSDSCLISVNFQGARLSACQFVESNLESAQLQGARLDFTNLTKTYLYYANLHEANLSYSNMNQADIVAANLYNSTLKYTKFSKVILNKETIFKNATYSSEYDEWPKGFNPKAAGMIDISAKKSQTPIEEEEPTAEKTNKTINVKEDELV